MALRRLMAALGRRCRRLFGAASAQPRDLKGRVYLVTGIAPGSIGFETARALAAWGATVIVTTRSRSQDAAQALRAVLPAGAGPLEPESLDLADAASVERLATAVTQRHGRLDGLVNNAGIHLDLLSQWREPKLLDGHEIHWRTNYLGTMQLTLRLLPLLLRSAAAHGGARVVNVVSMLHARGRNAGLFGASLPYNSWVAYGNSKLGLVHATLELQRLYAAQGLQAYCLHPGAVFTNIADKGLSGNPVLEAIRRFFAPMEAAFLLTPEEGAQTTLACATAPEARGGAYYRNCRVAEASADSRDAAVGRKLWRETESWLGSIKAPSQ
ncbi:SDR family NAD(P)-dependent oxidoreductase [Solimonas sp. K1W22B-7]|uniref:SDR family NAD(P)-dependent oxidoreductase n=1 Tax=Solimonas sp. K1W22B-7 TaxID=2303331 RepID=UPI000E330ED5|nr:SDR family NAD(P)-dependent oxidoreductase [Solimonas sp. K1W22B-7]AXQ28294.1 SDR family NAD(P)-dependent oxidoreductase [Solimonas sp. K1W22B-7]